MRQQIQSVKRLIPRFARERFAVEKQRWLRPPLEEVVLHGYRSILDPSPWPRLSLVIPSVSTREAFGGVSTSLELFLEIGRRTGADLRIILDQFEQDGDRTLVHRYCDSVGLDPDTIEVLERRDQSPQIEIRRKDVFFTHNWWGTLNIRSLLRDQMSGFDQKPVPFIYAIQEYEPAFDPMSSTHMMARLAYEPRWPCWGVINSTELKTYFAAQGHSVEREFVFEPRLSHRLRPYLTGDPPVKTHRMLVYGRPFMARNCYPAVVSGLRHWVSHHPEYADWEIVSAGQAHPPTALGSNRFIRSLGKLSIEDYGQLLRTSAVGLSLMASPHPSYPPLEMAHFGLRTVTNSYANKNLAGSHPNIISVDDIAPETISQALARACREFAADPMAGWGAETRRPSFLAEGPFPILDEISRALTEEIWCAGA